MVGTSEVGRSSASYSGPWPVRSWQSGALMSQNRHSCGLGTRLAGLSYASLRINAPRFRINWSSTASAGMRTVWSSYVACPPELQVLILFQRSWDGVQVNHHLDDVAGALMASLRVDDDGFVVAPRDEVGLARQRG